MIFKRTSSGISNYSRFLNADVIVFTEGKNDTDVAMASPDAVFSRTLLSYLLKGRIVKIKCVGNKNAALDYAESIEDDKIRNALVIIDRDFEGLTHSILPRKCVIQTKGYSWENDLWTKETCAKLLKTLLTDIPAPFFLRFENLGRRLRLIGIVDASLQPMSSAALDKKKSYGGIGFRFDLDQPLPLSELKRIIKKYNAQTANLCCVCREVQSHALQLSTPTVVQGHIWSNAVRGLIGKLYRDQMNEVAPSHKALLNIALSQVAIALNSVLGRSTVTYYRNAVRRALN